MYKQLTAENKKGTFDRSYQKSLFCGLQVQPFEPIFKGFEYFKRNNKSTLE
ncbi:MAG: hypothetical protein RI955_372 [Bacteroidota bacterium]|jgi:hypothetical protein